VAVGGAGHGVAPIVLGRSGAGPDLRGRPRDQVASVRFSKIARALSLQSSLSTCHLRSNRSIRRATFEPATRFHRAIFAPPAAGLGAIFRDGSSSALILMAPPVWLGRSLDRNGSGTVALIYKVRSSQGRGIGFRFVPRQKEVIRAWFVPQNRHKHSDLRTRRGRSSGTLEWHKTVRKAATLCHFVERSSCRLIMAENVRPTRLAFRHG
jgi:hypothetical protein